MGEHEENFIFEMGYNKGFKNGIKGSILKTDYEARLKADMVAMLTELQLEIEEAYCEVENDYDRGRNYGLFMTTEIIQQKINALKGEKS